MGTQAYDSAKESKKLCGVVGDDGEDVWLVERAEPKKLELAHQII